MIDKERQCIDSLTPDSKLKLIGDMSQLEYSLNQLLIDNGLTLADLENEYKALKSFRLVMHFKLLIFKVLLYC